MCQKNPCEIARFTKRPVKGDREIILPKQQHHLLSLTPVAKLYYLIYADQSRSFLGRNRPIWQNTELRDIPLRVEYTLTQDRVHLALARYRKMGAQPVILMHGFAQNYRIWDFPVAGHSLARYLYDRGYDVWMPCPRGHGDGRVQSAQPAKPFNVDDIAIYDVPAIIDKVTVATKMAPVWIGHSQGGMLAYMYLQGTRYQKKLVAEEYLDFSGQPYHEYADCAIGDVALARQRNQKLKALVTVASPTVMKWEKLQFGAQMRQKFWRSNKLLPWFMKMKFLIALASQFDSLPTISLLQSCLYDDPKQRRRERWLKKLTVLSFFGVAHSYLASMFWYPTNMNQKLIDQLVCTTLNDVSTPVFQQFADWIEHETFRSFIQGEEQPYIYSDNFDKITLPLLVIAGQRDKIASHQFIYQGYQAMSSPNKAYHCFNDFGHNDLCIGFNAAEQVYPFIDEWLQQIGDG